ncbi:MAG: TetR family transcriptional regulator [Bacteroidales bacterium]|nr:TetR family transcriptional regulator [Bacteroidales bacterium]MBN2755999.1 TetR family transcriptional regulator [Bacteroidales bacterium]
METTELKIIEAAKKVFVRKGKDGTRMQEIADEAGINKSLLHYYYRTKEKLFGAVFKFAFSKFAPELVNSFNSDVDIFTKIENFINNYIDLINKNPFIPLFILNEINKKDASFVTNFIKSSGINVNQFRNQINLEIEKGTIKKIDPNNLIVNIIGLCVFPFIGKPLIQVILFDDNENEYDNFLLNRKKEVAEFIINSIKK